MATAPAWGCYHYGFEVRGQRAVLHRADSRGDLLTLFGRETVFSKELLIELIYRQRPNDLCHAEINLNAYAPRATIWTRSRDDVS